MSTFIVPKYSHIDHFHEEQKWHRSFCYYSTTNIANDLKTSLAINYTVLQLLNGFQIKLTSFRLKCIKYSFYLI